MNCEIEGIYCKNVIHFPLVCFLTSRVNGEQVIYLTLSENIASHYKFNIYLDALEHGGKICNKNSPHQVEGKEHTLSCHQRNAYR